MKMLDLFCGRWGWSRAFAARGWECVGIDLVHPSELPSNCEFHQMNILGLTAWHVKQFEIDFICASPPCEQFSVHGMKHFHPNPPYPELGIKLFEHTRRICEASGVPYVIENVRAAQQFVGNAVRHCGPFYLWGNAAPTLIPWNRGKNMSQQRKRDESGKRIYKGNDAVSKKLRASNAATIPPELASCVAQYAERLLEQQACAKRAESA